MSDRAESGKRLSRSGTMRGMSLQTFSRDVSRDLDEYDTECDSLMGHEVKDKSEPDFGRIMLTTDMKVPPKKSL